MHFYAPTPAGRCTCVFYNIDHSFEKVDLIDDLEIKIETNSCIAFNSEPFNAWCLFFVSWYFVSWLEFLTPIRIFREKIVPSLTVCVKPKKWWLKANSYFHRCCYLKQTLVDQKNTIHLQVNYLFLLSFSFQLFEDRQSWADNNQPNPSLATKWALRDWYCYLELQIWFTKITWAKKSNS